MSMDKLRDKYISYSKAVDRLEDSLKRDISDELVIDAVIQRFEFTYELAWKLLKEYLSYQGIAEVKSPREAFKEGFAAGVIKEGDVWIDMLDNRNLTSHTYDEKEAKKVYDNIKSKYLRLFKVLCVNLAKELS